MIFNSIEFFLFFPIVFIGYWFLFNKTIKLQNFFIVVCSYFFYGWWDWRFLSLIIFSSTLDYFLGNILFKTEEESSTKTILYVSLFANLGLLGVFKYYNFFLDSFIEAFSFLGHSLSINRLSIILPVGISFYTFQTLSYTIDIYRKELKPTQDFTAFLAFVSFFPQLVAGPIERASNLLPQFFIKRKFSYDKAVDGTKQILWGFFKKVVVADHCAALVDPIFTQSESLAGPILILGAVLFSFQIYCDFSGYSDIAIGVSRLLGFDLKQNFAFPYFSRDIPEFWRRWHMSLSTWFRDYLYIPLGGSRVGSFKRIRNIFAIFLVSGFWHGANWTFIMWGFIHSVLYFVYFMFGVARKNTDTVKSDSLISFLFNSLNIIVTFFIVTVAWIFFRSDTISQSFTFIKNIFYKSEKTFSELAHLLAFELSDIYFIIASLLILLSLEWYNRFQQHGLQELPNALMLRATLYVSISLLIIDSFHGDKAFIYFQF